MTREEAIAELKYSIEMVHFDPLTGETSEWLNEENQRYVDACNMAIKALEQKGALDKVEAEIKDTLYVDSLIFGELIDFMNGKIDADDVIEEFNRVTRSEVLKIIDEYRAESEDKKKLSWLGKRCEDCGNKKCKELGELPKGYDCALWQAESEG